MRPGQADADSIRATKNMLSQSQQPVLGLVANGIDVKGTPDLYFTKNQNYAPQKNSARFTSVANNSHDVNSQVNANSHL